jgi:hypothetical protein
MDLRVRGDGEIALPHVHADTAPVCLRAGVRNLTLQAH